MTEERKYREEEAKEIFGLAVRGKDVERLTGPDQDGLTLSQLQEVGLEVGMDPTRIAEAAFALDARREVLPRGRLLGVPVSVGRVVELPRALTDREWDVVVGELRETFEARGAVAAHGGIREWTNGNLQAFLEPTSAGQRLRMSTRKGSALPLLTLGTVGLVLGVALMVLFSLEELGRASMVIPFLMAVAGGGTLGTNLLRLPRWARERETQMEYISGRVGALATEPTTVAEPEPVAEPDP